MNLRLIFYDTETTGIKPDKDRVVEIAAYDPRKNKTFSTLINPQMHISEEASAITHITDEMVKDAPLFKEAFISFQNFCETDFVLVAHNNDAFDRLFLETECARCDIALSIKLYIDSLKWARKYRKDLPHHNLQYLREIYEVQQNQAHRALDDSIVLEQVFSKMVGDLSVEKILSLLYTPTNLLTMPFGKYQGTNLKDIPQSYIDWLQKNGVFEKEEKLKASFESLGMLQGKKL